MKNEYSVLGQKESMNINLVQEPKEAMEIDSVQEQNESRDIDAVQEQNRIQAFRFCSGT